MFEKSEFDAEAGEQIIEALGEFRVNDFLRLARQSAAYPQRLAPYTVCADGYMLSIQASHFHYCSPRRDEGPWEAVEIAAVDPGEDFAEYFDSDYRDGAVYGYVPVELIERLVADHGGFAGIAWQDGAREDLPSPESRQAEWLWSFLGSEYEDEEDE